MNYRKKLCDPFCEYSFNSARKLMTTSFQNENGFRIYTKGSPEKVLQACNRILIDGKPLPMTTVHIKTIEKTMIDLQDQSKRVLAFAFNDFENDPDWDNVEAIEKDLIFIGFVGIEDPLRKDAKEAIDRCKLAGIKVKMLTGDNINTAKAIANQLGIIEKDSLVLEVTDIDKMR